MKLTHCVVCLATLTLRKVKDLPYCKTEACARAYIPTLVKSRTHVRDGHTIWDGSYHSTKGRPYCQVQYWHNGRRHAIIANPMEVMWTGPKLARGYTLTTTCDEPRCISHLASGPRGYAVRKPSPVERAPKLPVAPLVRAVKARQVQTVETINDWTPTGPELSSGPGYGRPLSLMNNSGARPEAGAAPLVLPDWAYAALKWAAEHSGQIDLYVADRICCDVLDIHPYFVFGQQFFDAI